MFSGDGEDFLSLTLGQWMVLRETWSPTWRLEVLKDVPFCELAGWDFFLVHRSDFGARAVVDR